MKGKLLYLKYGMFKLLLSCMVHLRWQCSLAKYEVICILLECPWRNDMQSEVIMLICICMITFQRLKWISWRVMSWWSMHLICKVWQCVNCDECWVWAYLEVNDMNKCYYVKGVLLYTFALTLECLNEVNGWKCGIVGWTLFVSIDKVYRPFLLFLSMKKWDFGLNTIRE